MSTDPAHEFAERCYQSTEIICDYLESGWQAISNVPPENKSDKRKQCLETLYLRVLGWLKTLKKLNDPVCVQAILTAPRSLLEIAVDMILLHYDETNKSAEMIDVWATSERMASATKAISYYRGKKLTVPDEYKTSEVLNDKLSREIKLQRKHLWEKEGHPRRWTGNDLPPDIQKADSFHCHILQADLGMTLEELYCTDFKKMSWFVHSGLAGFRGISAEILTLLCARAFYLSAGIGVICASITLEEFGFTSQLDELKEKWHELKNDLEQ